MAKYGPAPLPEEAQRILASLSISNKEYPRLSRLRASSAFQLGHELSREELIELVKHLAYQAIDAYCEQVERSQETLIV